jgi:hypothetical protein
MPSANSLAGVGGGLWWFRGRMNGLLALDGLGDAQRQQPRPVARNAAGRGEGGDGVNNHSVGVWEKLGCGKHTGLGMLQLLTPWVQVSWMEQQVEQRALSTQMSLIDLLRGIALHPTYICCRWISMGAR